MNKKPAPYLYTAVLFTVLITVCLHIGDIFRLIGNLLGILKPVFAACLIAFILNVPMVKIERLLLKLHPGHTKKESSKTSRVASLAITILLIAGIYLTFVILAAPPLVSSLKLLASVLQKNIPVWTGYLKSTGFDADEILRLLPALSGKINDVLYGGRLSAFLFHIPGHLFSTFESILNGFFAFILSLYILTEKKTLYRQLCMTALAYIPGKAVKRTLRIWNMICRTYSCFLFGQCLEACILGTLMFLVFLVLGIPYAGLIAVLTALLSFIPYIGSYLSCIIGALLIFLVSPSQVLIFIIAYQLVQSFENQFIYPHVVGSSVGLSAFTTLIAVLIGGSAAGIPGMLFAIPLTSVFFALPKEFLRKPQENSRIDRLSD